MHARSSPTVVAALLALTLAACGGKDGPNEPGAGGCDSDLLGSFTGNATGTAPGALSGCAFFGVSELDNGTWFSLGLTNGPAETGRPLVGINLPGTRPAPGTYTVGDGPNQFGGSVIVDAGNELSRLFIVSSGTLTFTASSAKQNHRLRDSHGN